MSGNLMSYIEFSGRPFVNLQLPLFCRSRGSHQPPCPAPFFGGGLSGVRGHRASAACVSRWLPKGSGHIDWRHIRCMRSDNDSEVFSRCALYLSYQDPMCICNWLKLAFVG